MGESIKNMSINFAKALKSARSTKGFSQQKLAELTGIARTNLSAYENNKILPGLETVIKMSEALEMNVSELMACGEEVDLPHSPYVKRSHFLKSKNFNVEIPILDFSNINNSSSAELVSLFNKGCINDLPKGSVRLPVTESAYLLRIENDAMSPKLIPDDLVWIESDSSNIREKDIVLVRAKGESHNSFIRYIHFSDDEYIFTAENEKYPSIRYRKEDILYIHRWVFTIPKSGIRKFISA